MTFHAKIFLVEYHPDGIQIIMRVCLISFYSISNLHFIITQIRVKEESGNIYNIIFTFSFVTVTYVLTEQNV